MYLKEVADQSFILLQADWRVEQARALVQSLEDDATRVIIHRTDPKNYYYLYSMDEAIDTLGHSDALMTVHQAFDLHESTAKPTADMYVETEDVSSPVIVLDEEHVVGFYGKTRTTRGGGVPRGITPGGDGEDVARSLQADFPQKVKLNETVSLLVSLSAEDLASVGMPIAVPLGANIDIVVQPKRGFAVEGNSEGRIAVADEEESLPLQFKLKATELGPGRIKVIAFHAGQPLGAITVASTVQADVSRSAERQRSEGAMSQIAVHQPDLSLHIFEHESNGHPAFTIRLSTLDGEFSLKPFGPVKLKLNPLEFFNDLFKDIEKLPLDSKDDKAKAKQRLAAKGAFLFENLIPPELQVILWSRRNQIKTIEVQSEEPWIPWEICRFVGKENGRIVEGPFMCEDYAMTRWILGLGTHDTLNLKNIALVVPKDSGLPYANKESDFIKSLSNSDREVKTIPATFLDVLRELASGNYDGWHFSGHGSFRNPDPNRSSMVLQDGDRLTPEDLSGSIANLGLKKPFVFLNACQIGRNAMSLTDIGGWAAGFLKAGASGFVGAHWAVYDNAAYQFAEELYKHLLSGLTVGEAAREARNVIKKLEDPTWLAYTVYAHPSAKVA